jgi:hypothetical protein
MKAKFVEAKLRNMTQIRGDSCNPMAVATTSVNAT